MAQPRSRYAVVWDTLKATKKCSIKAEVRFHARIKKAVAKRKDEDLIFKLECADNKIKFKIKCITDKEDVTILMFSLVRVYGVNDL